MRVDEGTAERELLSDSIGVDSVEMHDRPVILVFSDFYLPGYKSGGGMRTLVNLVERFGDDYDFRIVTRDHDGKTDKTTYPKIELNSWTTVGKASVRYLSKDRIRLSEVKRISSDVGPDCIFLNSYFSTLTIFVLLFRKFGGLRGVQIVIAPQGELAEGGLEIKRTKKFAFLRFSSRLGLYRDIFWRTTSKIEAEEVARAKGKGGRIFVAPDLPSRTIFPDYSQSLKREKKGGAARFVFLSRIHPKKNLTFLLELIGSLNGKVQLDIIGPIDASEDYVRRCRQLMSSLPSNVSADLRGGVEHERVFETLVEHDFFVLPTLAENFGHVFLEAMSAGCPLIISDRTPWIGLEDEGIGWDIPLDDREKWIKILEQCVEMDNEAYSQISARAREYAENWIAGEAVAQANREVFEYALSLRTRV